MTSNRRKFTVEQKPHLLREADEPGIAQTLRKHNLSHSVYRRWKQQLTTGVAAGEYQGNTISKQVPADGSGLLQPQTTTEMDS